MPGVIPRRGKEGKPKKRSKSRKGVRTLFLRKRVLTPFRRDYLFLSTVEPMVVPTDWNVLWADLPRLQMVSKRPRASARKSTTNDRPSSFQVNDRWKSFTNR